MFSADDTEMLGGDRLSMFAHRREQLGDALAVDLLDAKELSERLVRAADLFEHLALNGRARKAAKLPEESPNGGVIPRTGVPGQMGAEITIRRRLLIPRRGGRMPRFPFFPSRFCGGAMAEASAINRSPKIKM